MLKKTITYVDYMDNERTEDFYFNLSKAELAEWELSMTGGLTAFIEKVVAEQDNTKLFTLFKELITRAYGERSGDGKHFVKSEELSTAFLQTEAYSELFMGLLSTDTTAAAFVNGILPKNLKQNSKPNLN